MRSGKDGQADDLYVLLQRSINDHFRSLTQAGIDDLHTGIPQRASNYFRATIVSVEARFRNQHPDS